MNVLRPYERDSDSAFSRTELIVVLCVIALAVILIAARASRSQTRSRNGSCLFNLTEIQSAYQTFVLTHGDDPITVSTNQGGSKEYGLSPGTAVHQFRALMVGYMPETKTGFVICPADSREYADGWKTLRDANISYAINLTARLKRDAFIVAADRNFCPTSGVPVLLGSDSGIGWNSRAGLHGNRGNAVLAGGNILDTDSTELRALFSNSPSSYALTTNVMAVP